MNKPDYQRLIDAETWAFIRKTEAFYPPDSSQATIAEQRAIYERMCKGFFRSYPVEARARDSRLAGVPVRRYFGRGARVVYLHGGGLVLGGLESHDDICAEISAGTGFEVIAVDYRLAPEFLHPAAHEDALAVVTAVLAAGDPVVVAGDSAGATLAASVALVLRQALAGHVLIYPGLGGDMTKGSYVRHAEAPMYSTRDVGYYRAIVAAPGADLLADATATPLAAADFSGLSPGFAVAAECDPLADDARAWGERIVAAGGQGRWVEEPGLVHGYLRARHSSVRAAASFRRIVAVIGRLGRGEGLQADEAQDSAGVHLA